ncbi:MAG: TetR/AcrR family transcriptional regulator [Paraperlucidibaca sp.]
MNKPPPIVAKRGRPRDPKRLQKIIEAASQQFLECGYDRASMDAVAVAAGVSKMTLYNNFASKDALFESCVAYRTTSIFADFNDDTLDPKQPNEALYLIAKQFVALMRADDVIRIHRLLYGLATTHPDICARFFNAGPEHVNQFVQRYLRAAHAEKSLCIDTISLAADQFLALQLGRPHLRATLGLGKPDAETEERLLRANVAFFTAAYGAKITPT